MPYAFEYTLIGLVIMVPVRHIGKETSKALGACYTLTDRSPVESDGDEVECQTGRLEQSAERRVRSVAQPRVATALWASSGVVRAYAALI